MAKAKQKSMKKYKIRTASLALVRFSCAVLGNWWCRHHYRLVDNNELRNIKPPYVLLINHASTADTYSMPVMLAPNTAASFLVSETAFTRWGSILRVVGGIPKKQFSVDTTILRNMKYILDNNRPVVIYPEGKYSVDGTSNIIQPSVAKMLKLLKADVVTMKFDGSYLHKPRWSSKSYYVDVVPTVNRITADEVKAMSVEQLHSTVVNSLKFDDYQYQRDNNIVVKGKHLVEGLEYILHHCPQCNKPYVMTASGNTLTCSSCGSAVSMDEYGVLHGGQFDSVPQWNNWQKEQLFDQIDNQQYSVNVNCKIYQQINTKYRLVGKGTLTHNDSGIDLVWAEGQEHFANGLFPTLSFDNDALFLPTPKALFKVYVEGAGTTVTLNYAIEHYYTLADNSK